MHTRTNVGTAPTDCPSSAKAPAYSASPPARATVADWCKLSGMGRSTTYEALGNGHLHAVKLGSRTLIDVTHGLAWLNSLPPAVIRPHGTKCTEQAA